MPFIIIVKLCALELVCDANMQSINTIIKVMIVLSHQSLTLLLLLLIGQESIVTSALCDVICHIMSVHDFIVYPFLLNSVQVSILKNALCMYAFHISGPLCLSSL